LYLQAQVTKREYSPMDHISRFPDSPGVYLMKDSNGNLLYIGKAVNLKNRVRSYFSDTHEDRMQIPGMMRQLADIDIIITNTETEALILEANLIRRHKPKYNIELRDDKHYPYLKVTVGETFPRLLVVRRVERDGAEYFGPYTDVTVMRRMADFAKRIFRLRDCGKKLPLSKAIRPCVNHSMKRCTGPCATHTGADDYEDRVDTYRRNIDGLLKFLKGRRNDLVKELSARMDEASNALRFEEAAFYRDQVSLIKSASRLQQVDLKLDDVDCDVFGVAEGDRAVSLAILHIREGLLMAVRNFVFPRESWNFASGSRDHILPQFYLQEGQAMPKEVIVANGAGFTRSVLQDWFHEQKTSTQVTIPLRGPKKLLVLMAEKNAQSYLLQKSPPNALRDLEDLQKALNLPILPCVIEAFDISNLGGAFAVAGMVQFKDGMPNKAAYRRYKIKNVSGPNDFAMMMETVSRRLRRLEDEGERFPDLLLIDGGKGQLSAAMEALEGFKNPPLIASIAEKNEILHSPCLPSPLALPPTHPARKLVERIRDEVHRYAVAFHRKLRDGQFTRSMIEDLPGIGKTRARELLRHFGSMERLLGVSAEEIAKVKGFSTELAKRLAAAIGRYR
jgi:excinuclease ABC subunit C